MRGLRGRRARKEADARARVLAKMLLWPSGVWVNGYEVWRAAGGRLRWVYAALHGLLEAGVLEDRWKEAAPGEKYPRRLYRLPSDRRERATWMLEDSRARARGR